MERGLLLDRSFTYRNTAPFESNVKADGAAPCSQVAPAAAASTSQGPVRHRPRTEGEATPIPLTSVQQHPHHQQHHHLTLDDDEAEDDHNDDNNGANLDDDEFEEITVTQTMTSSYYP